VCVPVRPPAEPGAKPPEPHELNRFFQIPRGRVDHLELLRGYEGDAFASTAVSR
jgi:hypothetical protein